MQRYEYSGLPTIVDCSAAIHQGIYRDRRSELRTIKLTDVDEFQREETG